MKIKKLLIATSLCLSPFISQANVYELPNNCQYGRVKAYDFNSGDVKQAVDSVYNIYTDEDRTNEDHQEYSNFIESILNLLDSFDYLRVESPKHVLQNDTFRVKGNLFDTFANVKFNNSEFGYVGTDKSSIEANAYHNMKFSKTYGYGLVWVNRAGGLCSAEGVWVQKEPEIQLVSLKYGQAVVRYKSDKYSQAAKDSNTKTKIEIFGRSFEGSKIEHNPIYLTNSSGIATLRFTSDYHGEKFFVHAKISDGNYSRTVLLGNVAGGSGGHRPCPTCEIDI